MVRVEPVMGTVASFHVSPGGLTAKDSDAAVERACRLLHHLDEVFSTWKPASPMSLLRSGQLDLGDAPPEIAVVLELCAEAREMSGGWFDPWAMPGGVDPTGLVKGWAAEAALAVISQAGAAAAMLNIGGDVKVFGHPPAGGRWRVGIRHPWRPEALACVLEIDAAVATSGQYERGDHLVNPRGDGRRPVASATVTGPRLAHADALATALAVGGDEVLHLLHRLGGYAAYLIRSDGTEEYTEGIVVADVRQGAAR